MEFDPHLVQDFDEDLGFVERDNVPGQKAVPTFYSDVYTTNERLDFQNRQQQPTRDFDFHSDQPIQFTKKVTRIMPGSNTLKKSRSSKSGKSKSKSKKRTGALVSMKKKKTPMREALKKKTYDAYIGELRKGGPGKEDWNFETKTTGYFDKSLRRQMISHPLREKLEENGEDVRLENKYRSRDGILSKRHRNNTVEESKKNYYTDVEDFHQDLQDAYAEQPTHARLTRSEKKKTRKEETRAFSSPPRKKEIDLEKQVQTMLEKQEDKHGKPNPYFARQAREMLRNKRDKQFFVSMSVPREELYQPMPKARKNRKQQENTQPKYLEYTTNPPTKRETRSPPREAGLREIDKSQRLMEQERIYSQNQAEHTEKYKKALDMYPSRENGDVSMNDINSFSAKKRNASTSQGRTRFAGVVQDVQRKYINEDLKRYHKQEIERRVEVDHALEQYKNKLEERTADPNQYFNKISRGLENLRKDFNAVSQDLQQTGAYVNKNTKMKPSRMILARGAGKIIKVYADKLTELLLDDMIYEMIPVLQMKERNEQKTRRRIRKNDLLNDCMEALKDLTFEQKRVQDRAEEIYTLTTVTKNRMKTLQKGAPSGGSSSKTIIRRATLEPGFIKTVADNTASYKQFRKNTESIFSERSNIAMDLYTRTILDDLTKEVLNQFLEAQNDFVEQLLVSEFQ